MAKPQPSSWNLTCIGSSTVFACLERFCFGCKFQLEGGEGSANQVADTDVPVEIKVIKIENENIPEPDTADYIICDKASAKTEVGDAEMVYNITVSQLQFTTRAKVGMVIHCLAEAKAPDGTAACTTFKIQVVELNKHPQSSAILDAHRKALAEHSGETGYLS